MSNEITNHETPVRKGPNWLAVGLITIGALLLVANLALMTVGRIANRVSANFTDGIVVRGVNVDGSEFVIEDFDQIVEADLDRFEAQMEANAARVEAEAARIEAQAEANAARVEAEAARIDAGAARIEQQIDRLEIPVVRTAPRIVVGPFGPRLSGRFNRGPNLWGAAFLLLGLYFITRSRRQQPQTAPATGPEADPPAAA